MSVRYETVLHALADGADRLRELEAELLAAAHAATHALQQLAGGSTTDAHESDEVLLTKLPEGVASVASAAQWESEAELKPSRVAVETARPVLGAAPELDAPWQPLPKTSPQSRLTVPCMYQMHNKRRLRQSRSQPLRLRLLLLTPTMRTWSFMMSRKMPFWKPSPVGPTGAYGAPFSTHRRRCRC